MPLLDRASERANRRPYGQYLDGLCPSGEMMLEQHGEPCPLCSVRDPVLRNDLAIACFHPHPLAPGHMLIVPHRHVASLFETTSDERLAMIALGDEVWRLLGKRIAPQGYTLQIDVGEVAGLNIMHLHAHVIPRYRGDHTG